VQPDAIAWIGLSDLEIIHCELSTYNGGNPRASWGPRSAIQQISQRGVQFRVVELEAGFQQPSRNDALAGQE